MQLLSSLRPSSFLLTSSLLFLFPLFLSCCPYCFLLFIPFFMPSFNSHFLALEPCLLSFSFFASFLSISFLPTHLFPLSFSHFFFFFLPSFYLLYLLYSFLSLSVHRLITSIPQSETQTFKIIIKSGCG